MYHELLAPGTAPLRADPGYTRYVVTRDAFRTHLAIVRSAGRTGCALGELLDGSEERVVALSFDDGCASDLDVAAPLLDEYGFRATFFLTTAWLDKPGFLTAAGVRELAQRGFEIGSHSVSHAYLSDLDDTRLRAELADSKDRLEQIVGSAVRQLSCPGGRWSPRVADAARAAGYVAVADSRPVPHRAGGNRLRIGRFAVFEDTRPEEIERLATRGSSGRARLRAAALDSARAILGNRRYDRLRRSLMERGRP